MSAGLSGREGNSLSVMTLKTLLCSSPCCTMTWPPGPCVQRKGGTIQSWGGPFPPVSWEPRSRALSSGPGCWECPVCPLRGQQGRVINEEGFGSSTPVPVGSPPSVPAYLGPCSTAGSSSRPLLSSCDSSQCPCNQNYLPCVLPLLGVGVSDNYP